MDLVLIRHPAVAVEPGVCYGSSDVPLAGDAAHEAARLAQRLDALGARAPLRVESSPLTRCARIAHALASAHGLAPCVDERLAEMDFGAWEMRRWDAIERAQIDAWAADFEHARMHGGESVAQFDARVGDWLDEARVAREADEADTGDTAWVVTHAGVIRALTARALDLPISRCVRWPLEMAALVWLRRDAASGQWSLVRWNV
ncbi:MAG: alpha-ribazole phosphatase [Paraburkholderia sp.]|uniref:alpha-ribazole phosphatase n=1 Tax=Paraburkholderia sp. TaxID=1926495 RepID=UPI00120BAEB3|nr:alpha-ribazole phosphatase [Paraburkholderia sp.]TAM05022.1 MAG: alpha-ribazole phosphatase [Paraburkholderia sp.]TAM32002.1 MAG: alpha-ribazole phosphatase [Paraburkholderia sp.]